eukprot:TRINITY_DN104460_c0_g1_i1.p1 TRINITY_DN104460_c0_g1~~TRINITY_DN104460_c0_g1_i1.p1  ORF type:complete len:136 (+),score=9.00 TRINITY_DN104460_c0_g1_i1:2-409(+)
MNQRHGNLTVKVDAAPQKDHVINGLKFCAADSTTRERLTASLFPDPDVVEDTPSVTEHSSSANSAASLQRIRDRNRLKQLSDKLERDKRRLYNNLKSINMEFSQAEGQSDVEYVDALQATVDSNTTLSVQGRKIF